MHFFACAGTHPPHVSARSTRPSVPRRGYASAPESGRKPSAVNVLYTTGATATGGRDGRAKTNDGALDVKLTTPKELGGGGGPGNNPEQLFACGYAACFLGAMKAVASRGGHAKVRDPFSSLSFVTTPSAYA